MLVYGVDFTCAPGPRKPITCAVCHLQDSTLTVEAVEQLTTWGAFEALLQQSGPWVGGFDFPFGQPRRLVEALGWPQNWAGVVGRLGSETLVDFAAAIARYRDGQPPGDKHHLRKTDRLAGAVSPMMLYGVPVGRMFFTGAPRLLAAGVSVLPCHAADPARVTLEVYPALAARRWIGRESYKAEGCARQTPQREAARRRIVDGMLAAAPDVYGFRVHLADGLADALVRDAQGDALDAVLAALPAAWASRTEGWGIPPEADRLEGWIVDPGLVPQSGL